MAEFWRKLESSAIGKHKKTILKVLFLITFLPYVFLLGVSTLSIFTGFTFMTNTHYGFQAFSDSFVIWGLTLCLMGIIPLCLIIQLVVLIYYLVNRNTHQKNSDKSVSKKPFVIAAIVVICIVAACLLWYFFGNSIKRVFAKPRAISMYERSEEIIPYNYYSYGHLFNDDRFVHNTILIDWDKEEIGFVMDEATDRFVVYDLVPGDVNVDGYYLQSQVTLDDGCVFSSYKEYDFDTATTLVIVVSPDGTTYKAEMNVCEYLELDENSFEK